MGQPVQMEQGIPVVVVLVQVPVVVLQVSPDEHAPAAVQGPPTCEPSATQVPWSCPGFVGAQPCPSGQRVSAVEHAPMSAGRAQMGRIALVVHARPMAQVFIAPQSVKTALPRARQVPRTEPDCGLVQVASAPQRSHPSRKRSQPAPVATVR
ncbi:MAG: hypothetical protein R3A52_19125 [Polyangiales bacterium]